MTPVDASADVTPASMYRTTVLNGQSALKALLILNGGAAIAFLSFMGTAVQRINMTPSVLDHLIGAMAGFIFGAFAAVLSSGFIFLTNCSSYAKYSKTSAALFTLTCAVGVMAFIGFVYGGVEAVVGFKEVALGIGSGPCMSK